DPLLDPVLGIASVAIAALEIELVRQKVVGRLTPDPGSFFRRQLGLQRRGGVESYVVLNREDGGHPPVVCFAPEMTIGFGVDQLGDDPDLVAGTPNAAIE